MTNMMRVKLALLFGGIVIWAWGYRTDDSLLRIIGIAALLVAFLLRFVDRQKRSPTMEDKQPPTP